MDNARMISYAHEQEIQKLCRTMYHDSGGANPILVLTVKSMSSAGGKNLSFTSFTKRAYRQTGMHKSKGDTGVMILIALGDKRSTIHFGSGWSQELRTKINQSGQAALVASLTAGKASSGLVDCVREIDRVIRQLAFPSRGPGKTAAIQNRFRPTQSKSNHSPPKARSG